MSAAVRIDVYDTTLRDGSQAEDISFTVEDKLRIVERLDDLGVKYVEGGWPGSNPRDEAFFEAAKLRRPRQARIAAFGSTRRAGVPADADSNIQKLVRAETPVVTIFGKSWDLHVRDDLRISNAENLEVIYDSIAYLKRHVDEVIFDAEHFFDGYRANRDFAIECCRVAMEGGADLLCLCDTNGGRLPNEIAAAVDDVRKTLQAPVGIHCHNDAGLAVANTLVAVEHGATQVQGTINGIGERCGNVDLCAVIANLQLKMGYDVVSAEQLRSLREVSHFVWELANQEPNKRQPFVGLSAFAHKGGIHVAAVRKNRETYEHIDPAVVGNHQRVLVSDLSGQSNLLYKAGEFGIDSEELKPALRGVLKDVKTLENQGFQFEGAEASLELLMQKAMNGTRARYFELIGFRVIDEKRSESEVPLSEATIMLRGPEGQVEHTAATGNGPVNALDNAMRKALTKFYPEIEDIRLLDYKVRVLDGGGTNAQVRVLVESGDGKDRWGTVGVSRNVIEASWQALCDSIDYKLYKDRKAATGSAESAEEDAPTQPPGR